MRSFDFHTAWGMYVTAFALKAWSWWKIIPLVHFSFLGPPIPNQLISILTNSPPIILPGQKSLMMYYKKFGNTSFPLTARNLSFLKLPTKRCSQMTLLLQEREPDRSGSCKIDITKAPPRELQPHNIQLPIIYSVARFSAGINQSRFLAFNRGKLIYASWQSGPACVPLAQC